MKSKYSIIILFILLSCKEEREITPPVIIKPATTEYLKFSLNSANQLMIFKNEKNSYSINTTGGDPYVMTEGISKTLHRDSVVLTFEYKSSGDIDKPQIFFGPSISENRSVFGNTIPTSSTWKKYSLNLAKARTDLAWGKQGDFIRFDFGTKSGIDIEIRNIYFRSMNESEKEIYNQEEEKIKQDEAIKESLGAYLKQRFPSSITEVKVGGTEITVTGNYSGKEKFFLAEVYPNDTLVSTIQFKNKTLLDNSSFRVTLPRMVTKNNMEYDRLLSRWVIVKENNNEESLASHARYPDIIEPKQSMPPSTLLSKKGLGGFFMNQFVGDLDDLDITSITINILVTGMIYTTPGTNRIPHTYGGKTYYMSTDYLKHIDEALRLTTSKNIVVAAIILVQKATECADPAIGKILQHPDFTSEGIYTMPNITTDEGVNCYAAALDFLASRYNRPDNAYGRIHKWIMHNEVDAGLTWTNMGRKPLLNYLDTYLRSMRICHNISRQYDEHSEVMGSFTHSWVEPVELYSSKELLTTLQQFSKLEGDFQWGVAYHPYPQDLNEPKTWLDAKAIFSPNSPLVTFKNLEVIDDWIKKPENLYKGSIKRSLWLSENGTNSRTYETKDLEEQAAGFAYAWKKLKNLDGIDAIQWHNWIDNREEQGLRIGLRRFPDDETNPGGPKPVWHAYQAAGTSKEDVIFAPYKSIIGITDWNEIMHYISPVPVVQRTEK